MKTLSRVSCYFLLIILILPAGSSEYHRAIWVTRWDYNSVDDVKEIMKNIRDLGANEVLFQVRGNGTVFFNSSFEPWAGELSGDSIAFIGMDPGWDPLQTAIEEAHKNNLKIHAWMNVFPGWRGTKSPPKHSDQMWIDHPTWFIVDQNGRKLKPQETGYAFVSPGNPDVRQHIVNVFGEVAKKYPDLDGIHMDYIRYPAYKEYGGFRDFSYDKTSVSIYRKKYKKWPKTGQETWSEFKQNNVTSMVRMIRNAIRKSSASMELSSTFMAEINSATEQAGQSPMTWLGEGLVDWVVPMAYRKTIDDFQETLEEVNHFLAKDWSDKIVVGINIDFNTIYQIQHQMNIAYKQENGGEALFAYSTVYKDHVPTKKASVIQSIWKEEKLKDLLRTEIKTSSTK